MEKKKMTLYGMIFFICLFLIVTFFFSTNTVNYAVEQQTAETPEPELAIKTGLESPLVELEKDSAQETIELIETEQLDTYFEQIQTMIDKAAADFNGELAVTYVDTTTGKQLSVNGKKEFYTASTIKVPLAMMVADRVSEGVFQWDDQVVYSEENDYEEGTGKLLNDIQPSYSLQTLQEYNITYSDNIAKNMLYGLFGGDKQAKRQLYRYFFQREANVEDTQFTSQDGAKILLKLYREKADNKEYQKIYDYMKNTVFHERMETSLTKGKVAHKIGSYDSFIHDIGILETSHPFVLSIFTNGKDGSEAISALTDQLWKMQSEQYPATQATPQQLIDKTGA
ncbi:serine hydrolase [Enterococcus sp. LJL51]|uniref:serine hydrolase n=1 Tax=Enterococcus sp. LJL51 TaxID=3416656 RepID=UPI003CEE26F0